MKVKVCVGSRCTMMGANGMLDGLEALAARYFANGELEIEPVNCMSYCKEKTSSAPVVEIDGQVITKASLQEVSEKILHKAEIID